MNVPMPFTLRVTTKCPLCSSSFRGEWMDTQNAISLSRRSFLPPYFSDKFCQIKRASLALLLKFAVVLQWSTRLRRRLSLMRFAILSTIRFRPAALK